MPSKTKPKPPAKPAATATRKALLAYQSELNKYHRKLEQWEKMLHQRSEELAMAMRSFEAERADFDGMVDEMGFEWEDDDEDEECECTAEDALNGCPCDGCIEYRASKRKQVQDVVEVGDEVVFLENLFKLKDKRKR